jgi:hypothetical protein
LALARAERLWIEAGFPSDQVRLSAIAREATRA